MRRIEGHAKAVRDVLSGKRYSIAFVHCRWQQRLTTLTLLLILPQIRQADRVDRVKLEDLIYVEKYGERSFNIAVPERADAMEALFKGQTPDVSAASESVQTIVARFDDLAELLDETDIDDRALPFFCDWLVDNVHMVEITAATDEDAYTIFETMNDRGLSLSPLDMLKGFLLSSITDADKRNLAAGAWRERIESLRNLGKDEDADAVKAWLRGRHAQTVRERRRGSENQDFEKIGTEFHRWVGDHEKTLGIGNSVGCFAEKLTDQGTDFNGAKDGAREGMEQFSLNQWSKLHPQC